MERKGTGETVKVIKQPRLLKIKFNLTYVHSQWKKLIFMAFKVKKL